MKKNAVLMVVLFLLTGLTAFSQTYIIMAQPVDSKEWGYANLKGEFVIAPKFRTCIGFSEEGYAAIYDSKLKQFYFINVKGETLPTEITGFKLYEIFGFGMKGFSNGFAAVKYQEKWGYLDTQGKLAIPATFDKAVPFNSGYASGMKNGKFYVIDKQGTESLVDIPGVTDVNKFSENLASFKTEQGSVGFIDGNGKTVIPATFKSAGDFNGGIAWAKDNSEKIGYINAKGEWIIQPRFEGGKDFDPVSGLARVKAAETWAYTNKNGDLVYMKDTDLFEDFIDGLARGKKEGKFGYFNPEGEWAIPPQFEGARDFKNGYASVKKGEKWGIIDKTGKWVIEPAYQDIKDVEVIR